jgi:hypothetical protein
MSGSGWPGDDAERTQIMALPAAERQILAALAVIGQASLSRDELAAVVEVENVEPILADLERRGLIRGDQKKRYSAVGRIGEQIRRTDAALATGDRLLGYMTTLAKTGRLTPEQLVDDAEAILGLSEWGAETGQWEQLLELVKTLQACFAIANRVQEWLTLLHRARSAARALNDPQSEVWVLRQLATASASAGDAAASQGYLREADELERGYQPTMRRAATTEDAVAAGRGAVATSGGSAQRIGLWILGLIVAAGAGVGVGYAIGNDNGSVGATTAPVSVTLTLPGGTVTTSETVTLPATTVVSTTTVLSTTTELTTTTVTTTVAPPIP